MHHGVIDFRRGGLNVRRQAFELELRIGPREIGEQPRPLGRGRCCEKLGCEGKLVRSADRERLAPVRPIDQEGGSDDDVQRDDRRHHQRCDLSADPFQIEKAGQLHGQWLPEADARTLGVNK